MTNEPGHGGLCVSLTTVCLWIHAPIYQRLDAHSRTSRHKRATPCKKKFGALRTRRACRGLVIFEIKNTSSHSAFVPGTRKGNRKVPGKSCSLFFLFLSFLLNQKTSTSKGGRIRGAPQRVERERVASLILMGFLEVPTSSRRCAQRASRINRRRRAGQFALRKPLHVHGGGSSKPGRISRSVITLVGLQRKPTTVPGTHTPVGFCCSYRRL